MGAMAAASLLASHSQRKAQMAAKVADAKLQRARLERARVGATDSYQTNSQRARQATQAREVAIEESRLQAESKLDSTFAGSGISGTSVNELDNELDAQVAKNKIENRQALDAQLSDMTKNYRDTMNDTANAAASIDTTAVESNVVGDIAQAAGAASSVQGFGNKLASSSFGQSFSKSLGFSL